MYTHFHFTAHNFKHITHDHLSDTSYKPHFSKNKTDYKYCRISGNGELPGMSLAPAIKNFKQLNMPSRTPQLNTVLK